ncbi:helix-turn-helix domain-containing protein [Phascolarctobacterium faecium]|uniref:helix-turn-helix domain-containing protein n=1 Tax=Phascolarctobacterium faecium TaxID=33025 RepID=UPI003AB1B19E
MRIDRVKLILEMTRRGLTSQKLSEMAGLSRVTLSSVKRGASCSSGTVFKIAKALNKDPADLLETTED